MKEEMEQLVAAGKIQARHVGALSALLEAGFCQHKSWGFGKVKALDGIAGRLLIDFQIKAGHGMDLAFATETLKAISKDHILARKATDLKGLQQMAALHHLDVVKLVLDSNGGRATISTIQETLKDVIPSDWKKWWEVARAEMKKDGHFQIPSKKTDPIIYQAEQIELGDRLLAEFRAAKGLKARVAVVSEIVNSFEDFSKREAISEIIHQLNADITSHAATRESEALEGIFVRDELRQLASLGSVEGELTSRDIWTRTARVKGIFEELPAAKHRRALESFRDAMPDWAAQIVLMLNEQLQAKLVGECARLLLTEKRGQLLKDTLARLISQHSASSELLLWLGKERTDYFADILGPEVFRAMLTAIERDQFLEKKSNRLRDYVLEDLELLPELIESADIEMVRDLTRSLQLSPSFDDMDKRSLLARIVKAYPAIQDMITGTSDHGREDKTIQTSWKSIERRKAEYDELCNIKIPANIKDIALARSYGDLRENAEYKFAKEQQKILNRRKHELELQQARARGTDFANASTDSVNPGTSVSFTDLATSQIETLHILGAWDGKDERNVISYLSPVGQALLGKAVGAEATIGEGSHQRRIRLESIAVADVTALTA
jgi:transcription elongation GreA/GreB family factor